MKLGVLDLAQLTNRGQSHKRLQDLLAETRELERLGFSRVWFSEHQESRFVHCCPEIITAAAAAITSRIRVGPAGILMNFHSPLKVAESFRTLETFYPGRIDLGLAAGFPGHDEIRKALVPGFEIQQAIQERRYGKHVTELVSLIRAEKRDGENGVFVPSPADQSSPPIVLLGSDRGRGNMILAARSGAAFCYSMAHGDPSFGPQIVQEYRENFQPSSQLDKPHVLVAGNFICMETDAKAVAYIQALRVSPFISHTVSQVFHQRQIKANILGSPQRCARKIQQILDEFECDEMILAPLYFSSPERIRAYQMIAETCGLEPVEPDSEEGMSGLDSLAREAPGMGGLI